MWGFTMFWTETFAGEQGSLSSRRIGPRPECARSEEDENTEEHDERDECQHDRSDEEDDSHQDTQEDEPRIPWGALLTRFSGCSGSPIWWCRVGEVR
jgi:hypothetical protein